MKNLKSEIINLKFKGFTLIEILVSIAVLGILMASLMVAFNQASNVTRSTGEEAEVMQNIRSATEQFNRELQQAIINNNRPDGEQVYFEVKQLSREDSALRFGCTTERGLVEIGYQIKPSDKGWKDYELWRLYKNKHMWNYNEPHWPALDYESKYVEPFAFGIELLLLKLNTGVQRKVSGLPVTGNPLTGIRCPENYK